MECNVGIFLGCYGIACVLIGRWAGRRDLRRQDGVAEPPPAQPVGALPFPRYAAESVAMGEIKQYPLYIDDLIFNISRMPTDQLSKALTHELSRGRPEMAILIMKELDKRKPLIP